jgi:hypothetical protein
MLPNDLLQVTRLAAIKSGLLSLPGPAIVSRPLSKPPGS